MNIFGLIASFEAFWSFKNDLKFLIKNAYHTTFMYENYKIVIFVIKENKIFKNHQKTCLDNFK